MIQPENGKFEVLKKNHHLTQEEKGNYRISMLLLQKCKMLQVKPPFGGSNRKFAEILPLCSMIPFSITSQRKDWALCELVLH